MKGNYLLYLNAAVIPMISSCGNTDKAENQQNAKPNIIVIVADDLGWKDIGYHDSEINTPNLDQLAKSGAILERFYVHSVCSPTRASLITGRYPSRYGILAPLADDAPFPEGTLTLPEILKENGYSTAISGKWHLGTEPKARPLQWGFESSYGYLRGQIDPYTHLYKFGDKTWHRNDSLMDEEGHVTDLITNEAIRFINSTGEDGKPFFLYVAYSVPHFPLDEPEEWVNQYESGIENKSRRKFAASVSHMDSCIGQIYSTLENRNIDEKTMILFFSDNGGQKEWISATQYNGKFEPHDVLGNNLPLRDWKGTLYDGALRVPAFIHWKGTIESMKTDENINVADVFPTIANLIGIPLEDEWELDGMNFWDVLEGGEMPADRTMFWRRSYVKAVKKGNWKLIHFDKKEGQNADELYDIYLDPSEKNDISAENPEIVKELNKIIEEEMSKDQ